MTFTASPDQLLPPLTPAQEVVLLARTLRREGYDDHRAGPSTRRVGIWNTRGTRAQSDPERWITEQYVAGRPGSYWGHAGLLEMI